ncbi:right-handed parallel beta-helix repeat-containing protein, partial [Thermodesulfobacteriota bacterium]
EEPCNIKVPEDFQTIQEAINRAENGDTICVGNGTYKENINFMGKVVTIKSVNGAKKTKLDGNNVDSVVTFNHSERANSVLDGFTITNGGNSAGGGGIKCINASPTILNCMIVSNSAWSGGGIFLSFSSPTIYNCVISKNEATSGNGGGIYSNDSSVPIIANCIINRNVTTNSGGGIYCGYSSPLTITNCRIDKNISKDSGGGIYCSSFSPATIKGCIISNNSGSGGGGLFCDKSSLTIENSTVSDNVSKDAGGGILLMSAIEASISNCTITNNKAINTSGGGIFCYDTAPVMISTILWGNHAATKGSEAHLIGKGAMSISYSNVNVDEIFGLWTGTKNINDDPEFVDSEFGNYHLQKGSPCIDIGFDEDAPADDIDGQLRPQGKGIDIGSDEYKAP